MQTLKQGTKDDGFYLIWLYWVKKYMSDKMRPKDSIHQVIAQLKKHYTMEALDSKAQLEQKLTAVKESKKKAQWPIYLIDPEQELKLIEKNLHEQYEQYRNEIYCYYLNIKNIFIIYRNDWEGSEKLSSKGGSFEDNNNDNVSEGNRLYKSQIRPLDNRTEGNKSRLEAQNSSYINRIVHSCLEYESSECRNEESLSETVQHKIQDLQILDKMAEVGDLEVWNCKYKHIPHSYLKIKKDSWNNCLDFPLMHPSQPKKISEYPILPQLQPLKPSIDKLLPFVSYLKLLDKYFPGYFPTKSSIFQMNDLPVVFSRETQTTWSEESNVGVLCYFIVHGDSDNLTSIKVQRWAQNNPNTLLSKTIRDLNKRHRERNKSNKEGDSKPFSLFEVDIEGNSIW